jgi:general secretion pathway protein G
MKVYIWDKVGLFSAHRALAIPKDLGNVIPPQYGGFLLHLKTRTKIKQQGFTLLEIMLVVSIIVIILGVAISKLGNTTAIAKTMRVQADIQAIKTQLQLYESMNGFYPTTEQGLQALVTQPQNDPRPTRWYQLFRELPKDPWGSDYVYRNPGLKNPGGYDLFSAGPDRQADTADDDWGGG